MTAPPPCFVLFFSLSYSSSTSFPPNRRLEVEREGERYRLLDMGWGVGSFGIDVMVVRVGEEDEEREEEEEVSKKK